MHEQEFERSVQQKMEELSFTPSAPVWEKVEAEIKQRRKKRRLVFWLLPLGAAGVTLLFYLFQPGQPGTAGDLVSTSTSVNHTTAGSGTGTNRSSQVNKQHDTEAPTTPGKESAAILIPAGKVLAKKIAADVVLKRAALPGMPTIAAGVGDASNGNAPIAMSPNDTAAVAIAPQTAVALAIALFPALRGDSLNARLRGTKLFNIGERSAAATNKTGWLWSFQIQYGRSAMANRRFLAPVSQDFSSAPPGSVQNGTGVPAFTVSPLQVADGPFASAAIGLRKKVARHWYLHGGMQYAQYTQSVGVGRMVTLPNRSTQDFFEPGGSNRYLNRFHQVALPLAAQYQPFRGIPLELEAGIAPGMLVAAQTLRFDTAARLFTKHTPEVRQLQLPATAGIRYRLMQGRSLEWLAGVHMQYHLTGTYNRKGSPSLYAVAAGIQVRRK